MGGAPPRSKRRGSPRGAREGATTETEKPDSLRRYQPDQVRGSAEVRTLSVQTRRPDAPLSFVGDPTPARPGAVYRTSACADRVPARMARQPALRSVAGMNLSRTTGLAAAALLVLAGCSANAATPPTSPTARVVTLTLGTSEPEGRPTDLAMQDFATRVADLSHGSIVIDRKYGLAPADHDWDHAFAQAFLDGQVDLAMVPARAWETVGVTSLAALQAPMLVGTDELLDHVVTGDPAQTMLDGLGQVHTTGLALLPIGLRHLYFFGTPPTTTAEMAGRGVRGPQSPTVWAFLSALGMAPDDPATSDAYAEAVRAGTLGAAETTYDIAPGAPAAATAVGNLVPYPYVLTLAARDAALDGLSDAERQILHEAARRDPGRPDREPAVRRRGGGRVLLVGTPRRRQPRPGPDRRGPARGRSRVRPAREGPRDQEDDHGDPVDRRRAGQPELGGRPVRRSRHHGARAQRARGVPGGDLHRGRHPGVPALAGGRRCERPGQRPDLDDHLPRRHVRRPAVPGAAPTRSRAASSR